LHAEFSVLHRILPSGRLEIENEQMVLEALKEGPVIFVGMHTGNWEVLGPIAGRYGISGFYVYEPQISPMQNYVLQKSRARTTSTGTLTLAPGPAAALQALRTLKEGKPISIFCDEASANGLSTVPFFGRPAHLDSNYSIAVRLARKAKAAIIPFHCVRHERCRFKVKFGPLMRISGYDDRKEAVLDDVVRLNQVVEPIVRAHLDQWYWLGWGFAGVAYE
jgi:KDO2-lipid IV(A) lauroyltransferase